MSVVGRFSLPSRTPQAEAGAIMKQLVLPHGDRFRTPDQPRFCSDPDDDKFIHCALAAHAAALVNGDKAVLRLGPRCGGAAIISVSDACARYCR